MGTLRSSATGSTVTLRGRHRVGRSADSDLRLDDERVSGEHALLRWEWGAWVVQDLSSTNGVFLGGSRIAAGQVVPLDEGMTIGFGCADAAWELVDAAPPVAFARSEAGERRDARDGRLVLPVGAASDVVIEAVEGRGWVLQDEAGGRRLVDGEAVHVGAATWTLFLPELLSRTVRTRSRRVTVAECCLALRVSQDQEYVELSLWVDGDERALVGAAYGYLLVDLLGRREADLAEGVAVGEAGWVAKVELERSHRLAPNQLNVWLHRFQKSLGDAGVSDPERAIERRERGRTIRLGIAGRTS